MKKEVLLPAVITGTLLVAFLVIACGGGGGGGTDLEPFNTSCFPLEVASATSGFGNLAFDGDGNLIFTNLNTDEVLSVDRLSCTLSTLTTVPAAETLLSIVYHPGRDTIYVGDTGGNIFAVNPSSGASSLLVNIGNDINALVVAPEGYGTFEGQLLAAMYPGVLVAVDSASAATTNVADTEANLSDVEFDADGTLYGVLNNVGEVITISADGMTSVFASGFSGPDGIAVDNVGDRLLVADSNTYTLYGVQISDGARTALGSYNFDSGWFPSGLAFDGVQTVLMATRGSNLIIEALTF